MNLRLSDQALGAIMLALQKGIMEQTDITNMLKEFELIQTVDGLIVENPPLVEMGKFMKNATQEEPKEVKKPRKRGRPRKKIVIEE
jgi:hypothetical protein